MRQAAGGRTPFVHDPQGFSALARGFRLAAGLGCVLHLLACRGLDETREFECRLGVGRDEKQEMELAIHPPLADDYLVVAKRNDSLSPMGRRAFLLSIAVISLAVAVAMGFHGAWFVLPFAGLEIALLAAAFWYVERHAGDVEIIRLRGHSLLLERCSAGREERHEFNRAWARVEVRRGRGGKAALALRSHGKAVCFGELLTDEQRLVVAGELSRRLGGK